MSEFKEEDIQEPERQRFNYSIRGFIVKIFGPLSTSIAAAYVFSKLPAKLYIGYLFKLNFFTPLIILLIVSYLILAYKMSMKKGNIFLFFMAILLIAIGTLFFMKGVMIPLFGFKVALGIIGCLNLIISFYYILFVKTGFIIVDQRALEINDGILTRQKDSTDLTEIKDKDIKRNFIDLLLGISVIDLQLTRIKERISIKFLNKKDAESLYYFLRTHSYSSSREYWVTRDRRKKNKKDPDDIDQGGNYIDDGE